MRSGTEWLGPPILAVLTLAMPDRAAAAQGIEADLAGLALENAELFVQPLTRGLGFAMATGLFDGAKPLGQFGFDVGARVSAALPPTEAETFSAVLPSSIEWNRPGLGPKTYQNSYQARGGSSLTPTVVGAGKGVVLEPAGEFRSDLLLVGENPADYEIRFPEGLDIPGVPFLVFHASVGLGFGTELSFRFIPEIEVDQEVGGVRALGFSGRHAVSTWFSSPIPIDVALVFGSQKLEVGDYIEASSTQYGVVAERGLGPLSLFVSGIARTAEVDISYSVENPGDNPGLPQDGFEIAFHEDLDSGVSLGAGARLSLLFMTLTGQYVLDDYNGFSLKVGFGAGRR